jgi:3-(3-hydroxy-phenyl)propionate hydroxylase
MPAPEAELFGFAQTHLSQLFGRSFVTLRFSDQSTTKHGITISSKHSQAWSRYAAQEGSMYLIRPDGYIMAAWVESGPSNAVDVEKLIDQALKAAA